jgi:hypothetical protein
MRFIIIVIIIIASAAESSTNRLRGRTQVGIYRPPADTDTFRRHFPINVHNKTFRLSDIPTYQNKIFQKSLRNHALNKSLLVSIISIIIRIVNQIRNFFLLSFKWVRKFHSKP